MNGNAGVVEQVDTGDLKSPGESHAGSTPAARTIDKRLVKVAWVDSRRPTSSWQWLSEFEPEDPVRCVSVGWLLSEDQVISLAATLAVEPDGSQIMGVVQIPKECVIEIQNLEEG